MKIYTKTGDQGKTGLYSGKRIMKFDLRVESYGTVDELNSFVGLLREVVEQEDLKSALLDQQQVLFALGAALADDRPEQAYEVPESATPALEAAMDRMDTDLPRMTHFILPGGSVAIAHAHVCRTVCRRAERRVVELKEEADIDAGIVVYLNRLSDYFFVLSRHLGRLDSIEEVKWIS